MKSGKKPTRTQAIFIYENGLDSKIYLVERDTPEYMVVMNKVTKETIKIKK